MKNHLFGIGVVMIVSVSLSGGCRRHTTDADIRNISLAELRTLMADAEAAPDERVLLLIDPRTAERYEAGHIPSARNVQLSDVPREQRRREIEAFDHVVVYGDNPASAPAIAMTKRLIGAGYDKPRMYREGLAGWTAAGLEAQTIQMALPPER